jgi:excisionase family DNA binding protein
VDKKLVSAQVLAEVLDAGVNTIYDWAAEGRIPCYRIGRKLVRFDLDEVLDAIRERSA